MIDTIFEYLDYSNDRVGSLIDVLERTRWLIEELEKKFPDKNDRIKVIDAICEILKNYDKATDGQKDKSYTKRCC